MAKLFTEQMIAQKEGGISDNLPKDIPELMRQSIKILHTKKSLKDSEFSDVIETAKVVAWECLKKEYHPMPVEYKNVKQSLGKLINGERAFVVLEDKLKIIELKGTDDMVSFKIEPLAEYLAGMHLVEVNSHHIEKWQEFIERASSKQRASENIKGFLLAVCDCCLTENAKSIVSDSVVEKLNQITKTSIEQQTVVVINSN